MSDEIMIKMIEAIENPILLTNALVFVVFITVYRRDLVNLFKRVVLKDTVVPKTKKIEYLKNHDVYDALKRVTNEVKIMKFYTHGKFDKVKTKMCYDFTRYKATHCTIRMKGMLDTPNIDNLPKDCLRALVTKTQNEMHIDYINAIRNDWLGRGIPTEDVEHVVHLFEKFRYDVVNSFDHRITSIFGSGYHQNNFSIILGVYDMWAMGVDLLPKDMQTTFENLNGKFKDIKY